MNGPKLHGALDRFAQFFVAPLCLEDSMDRELLAVDSEFALAKQSDAWRLRRLMCQAVHQLDSPLLLAAWIPSRSKLVTCTRFLLVATKSLSRNNQSQMESTLEKT